MLFPFQTANLQAINAVGRSDVYLKLMAAKRLGGVVILGGSVLLFDDVMSIIYACLLTEIFAILVNIAPNTKILNYKFNLKTLYVLLLLF